MGKITEQIGDIFSAPPNSVLIHACNAKGVWGNGVAFAFKKKFPQAFKIYTTHCKPASPPTSLPTHQAFLAGTTLLIPPIRSAPHPQNSLWIACLFTSVGYGRTVDSRVTILANTARAIADLERQIDDLVCTANREGKGDGKVEAGLGTPSEDADDKKPSKKLAPLKETEPPSQYRAVRINSGKFGVPWSSTKPLLEHSSLEILVLRPPEDGGDNDNNEKVEVEAAPPLTAARRDTAKAKPEPRRGGGIDEEEEGAGQYRSRKRKQDDIGPLDGHFRPIRR